jgi:hypothetical protein
MPRRKIDILMEEGLVSTIVCGLPMLSKAGETTVSPAPRVKQPWQP